VEAGATRRTKSGRAPRTSPVPYPAGLTFAGGTVSGAVDRRWGVMARDDLAGRRQPSWGPASCARSVAISVTARPM
jgi:hypothetical protein